MGKIWKKRLRTADLDRHTLSKMHSKILKKIEILTKNKGVQFLFSSKKNPEIFLNFEKNIAWNLFEFHKIIINYYRLENVKHFKNILKTITISNKLV